MEMLVAIAIIAILAAVMIPVPVYASQLEKTKEAADIASVRSACARVSMEAMLGKPEATVTVKLKQTQADWQSLDPVDINGIVHHKKDGDTDNWKGVATPNGTCIVSYKEGCGIVLNWNGSTDSPTLKYPFNTSVTDFFSLLYGTDFWKDGLMEGNTNFEFDSRCPNSAYVPSITAAIEKLDNSLLQQPDCTWAYLGNGKDGQESKRYLFWTSLNTDQVGAGKEIPVIIQTGDGKYYVSATKTGKRRGKSYITISESISGDKGYKDILNAGEKFSSLEAAYDAYIIALNGPKYDSVRQS